MDQLQARGKDSSRQRYASVFQSPAFDGLRHKKLLETTTDDFFAVFKDGQGVHRLFPEAVAQLCGDLGWLAVPIVAPYLWPKYEPKDRRGITRDETPKPDGQREKAGMELFLDCYGKPARRRATPRISSARTLTGRPDDSYFRQKTGSLAQFTISTTLEKVLQQLPTTGALFPQLSNSPPTTGQAASAAAVIRRACLA